MSIENKIKLYVNSLVKANRILSPGETGGFWPPTNSGPSYSVQPTSPPPPPTSPWQSDPSYVPGVYSDPNGPYNCDNRPLGRFRVPVVGEFPPNTPQRWIDYYSTGFGGGGLIIGTRDARGSDACPSCQSSSHPVCECLDAYTQYDYYSYNYVAPGGFGDCIIPPTKQLPSHCPSREVNGIRSAGTISNYAFSTNGSVGGWVSCYFSLMTWAFPNFDTSSGGINNILGPTSLTGHGFGTTTLDDWSRFWQNIGPTHTPGSECWADPESIRLAKMMFEARCFVTEAVTTGACCIPQNLGGFYCAEVNSQEECPGQFHPGETCQGIGFDNCGSKDKNDKVSVTQSIADPMGINEKPEALVTQLSTALIKSLRGKK